MNKPHEICMALRAYRIKARIKQELIADALGVAQSQISRWESGRDLPRPHNIEAIKALIWGETMTPVRALVQFVGAADLPLVLFDHNQQVLAAGRPFQAPANDFARFGHIFDPARNPAISAIAAQYRALLADPPGLVGLEMQVPFQHDGTAWLGLARQTIYAIGGFGICLAELYFAPNNDAPAATPSLRMIPSAHRSPALA